MRRRAFLRNGLVVAASIATRQSTALSAGAVPVLDTHVHLFDPDRPGGVPWPEPGDPIRRPALPPRLQTLAEPLGVVGAIAIEASPLHTDNAWLLETVTKSPYMVGMVGHLAPATPGYGAELARLHRSPLFLGIRYGNLWHHDLATDWRKPDFLPDLDRLAQAGLVFETANPTPALLQAVLSIVERLPSLRVVLDHVPHMPDTTSDGDLRAAQGTLRDLAMCSRVFLKFSEVLPAPAAPGLSPMRLHDRLDPLWDLFGPHRVLFGSDWPNSDHVAPYADGLEAVQQYLRRRAPAEANAVFLRNSLQAYGWQPRSMPQRQALRFKS